MTCVFDIWEKKGADYDRFEPFRRRSINKSKPNFAAIMARRSKTVQRGSALISIIIDLHTLKFPITQDLQKQAAQKAHKNRHQPFADQNVLKNAQTDQSDGKRSVPSRPPFAKFVMAFVFGHSRRSPMEAFIA